MKKNYTLYLLFSFLLLPTLIWTQTVYWTERGNGIKSFDGTTTSTLVSSTLNHTGIAIDETNGEMYWCTAQSGQIRKANLDGSNQSTVLATGSFYIALDVPNNKMYWTIFGAGTVRRANLDGTNAETIASGQSSPVGIALDLVNNKVYWTESSSNQINRANLDGSMAEDITPSNVSNPRGLALDIPNNRMYWANLASGNISRADLDGSNATIIVNGLGTATNLSGVALDLSAGKVYWIEFSGTRIGRADLDGSNQELSYITGVSTSSESVAVGSSTPLPVELLSFKGLLKSKQVELTWQTASETNNEGFYIERSENGKSWKQLSFVKGAGTTVEQQNYSFLDEQALTGVSYYRLKQMDFDGAYEYSAIISVEQEGKEQSLLAYPNPVNSGQVQILLPTEAVEQPIQLDVVNSLGQLVSTYHISPTTKLALDVSPFQAGMYTLIVSARGKRWSESVIVE
ncbi:MAG: DUF5050 domain-containing protein [Bacteroidota bacterium]